jgi:hypothetical protein
MSFSSWVSFVVSAGLMTYADVEVQMEVSQLSSAHKDLGEISMAKCSGP